MLKTEVQTANDGGIKMRPGNSAVRLVMLTAYPKSGPATIEMPLTRAEVTELIAALKQYV